MASSLIDFETFLVEPSTLESSKDQEIDNFINEIVDMEVETSDNLVDSTTLFQQPQEVETSVSISFGINDKLLIPNIFANQKEVSKDIIVRDISSSPGTESDELFDSKTSEDDIEDDINMGLVDNKPTFAMPVDNFDIDVALEQALGQSFQQTQQQDYTYSATNVNPGEYLSQKFFTEFTPQIKFSSELQVPRTLVNSDAQLDAFIASERKRAIKIVQKRQLPTVAEGSKNKPTNERTFNYDGIDIPSTVSNDNLDNNYQVATPVELREVFIRRQAEPIKDHEQHKCIVSRIRYTRDDLQCLENLDDNVRYEKNPLFAAERPYQQEFTRVEIDPINGLPFNLTRAGLCAYCPNLKFSTIKNSNYCQHLVCEHGIYPDNYLAPSPYNYGCYYVKKNNTARVTKAQYRKRNGVICPICHEVVEANCTKKTATRPLINYLRHFRDCHRITKFYGDPLKYCEHSS